MVTTERQEGTCSRCGAIQAADVSERWQRLNGEWLVWVKVRPHLHVRTLNSTCKPKGYARKAADKSDGE